MSGFEVLDYEDPMDLLKASVEAFMSESEVKSLVERTQGGKKAKFRDKKWIHPKVPFGYEEDGDWISVDEEKKDIVREIFDKFVECENYTETARYINEKFGDRLDGEIKRYKIKLVVKNPVYKGKPTYGDEVDVPDPHLSIVDQDLFEESQKISDKIYEKNSGGRDDYIESKVEKLGLKYLADKINIRPICKRCESPMVKSGSKKIRGMKIGQYKCKECGHESTVPLGSQMGEFEGRDLISCPYCRVTENFVVDNPLEGKHVYRCQSCGGSFESEANPKKFLRDYPPEDD
ncbi:hypothetical protein AKJ52_00875 [candidate division MSBL1 archaeon SCGC-AAA382C18]|uniref:Recombinase domain-containing protein n=1 Tax=candidate division MSBL1 archaeon SCGC-AAA382C18 TaxID=1698281 RepID=A0A133VL20_9EURY|nr:hypothetical protein AKJ52_00875 [candidate division MSBL1 archaeon SCGC-AAA382C18]